MKMIHRMTVVKMVIHWALFAAVINNIITGFYIAYPFLVFGKSPVQAASPSVGVLSAGETYQAFIMAYARYFHFIGAVVMDVAFFAWLYLAFFSLKETLYKSFMPFGDKMNEAYRMLKHYFTLKDKPETTRYQDPLNAIIFAFFHILIFLQMVTGLQMYVSAFTGTSAIGGWWPWFMHFTTDWTLAVFGGLTGVTLAHLFIMWIIMAFVIYHIYTEVWRTIMWKEGDILIPFGGYKYTGKKVETE